MSGYRPTSGPTAPPPPEGSHQVPGAAPGDLFTDLNRNVMVQLRREAELAKAELRAAGRSSGKGAVLYAAAGMAGHLVLLFLSLAAVAGLAPWIGFGYAALAVAGLWAIVAVLLVVAGMKWFGVVDSLPPFGAASRGKTR